MSTRQDLADAALTAKGVRSSHPYLVAQTDPGTVWVRLDRVEYPNAFGGVSFWNVVLVLPQDVAEAERYLESTINPLREAIAPHLVVTSVTIQRLQLDGVGTLPVAFFNGHREAD